MKIYLDIDGVLLDYDNGGVADGAIELIEYVTKEFDCYWLTTHCKGDPTTAVSYLQEYFPDYIFAQVLDKFYEGKRCKLTLEMLKK